MTSFYNNFSNKLAAFIKTDEHQELLKKVNTHLLVWNEVLYDIVSGNSVALAGLEAEDLANAAKDLVKLNKKAKQTPVVALYLPAIEFVATHYTLPGVAPENIPLALAYQVEDLLPAYPGKLLLAVNHNTSFEQNIALWLDQDRADKLYAGFRHKGLELAGILPRATMALEKKSSSQLDEHMIREQDEHYLLHAGFEQSYLKQWGMITLKETGIEDYRQQWEKQYGALDSAIECVDTVEQWQQFGVDELVDNPYVFFPEAARSNLKKYRQLKKGRIIAIAAVVLVIVLALPFINNFYRYHKQEARYLDIKEKTVEIRTMRARVSQFNEEWGLFLAYPRADILAVMHKLNEIIPKDSWVSSLEIKEGIVEIEGYSPNATGLLEIISEQEEFSQAAFNQRTRVERGKKDERFGISFHLSNVDMQAYQKKYFPDR